MDTKHFKRYFLRTLYCSIGPEVYKVAKVLMLVYFTDIYYCTLSSILGSTVQ
jgi:hypothetical protein